MTIILDDNERLKLREVGEWIIQLVDTTTLTPPVDAPFKSAIPLRFGRNSVITEFTGQLLAQLAKEEYLERLRRRKFLDLGLLAEPAWDILLDLFINHVAGKRVSVTSACIASGVAHTTALRWLGALEEHELVVREADSFDRRRHWVQLTQDGYLKLTRYLTERANQRSVQAIVNLAPSLT